MSRDQLAPLVWFRHRFADGRSVTLHDHPVGISTLRYDFGDGRGGCVFLAGGDGVLILSALEHARSEDELFALTCKFLCCDIGGPADLVP